jgi:hypothetical protein
MPPSPALPIICALSPHPSIHSHRPNNTYKPLSKYLLPLFKIRPRPLPTKHPIDETVISNAWLGPTPLPLGWIARHFLSVNHSAKATTDQLGKFPLCGSTFNEWKLTSFFFFSSHRFSHRDFRLLRRVSGFTACRAAMASYHGCKL